MVDYCAAHPRPPSVAGRLTRAGRGSALVYVTASLVALMAFASLAVDLGRVYVVRSELQLAADAAARYGAAGLPSGTATAENNAITAAGDNKADGTRVTITASDVEFGTWNSGTRTFSVLTGAARSNANAVRVTARRTSANGGGVPLLFARVIGKTACNVTVSSTAIGSITNYVTGIVGFGSVMMKNNTFIGGYNSAVTTDPTTSTATSAGILSSNGVISGGNNNDLSGSVTLGPSAPNVSGISVSGTTTRLDSALVPPTQSAWNPQTNPGGIPADYAPSSTVTLPGGTYYFTSLTVTNTLQFSGAATVYVNGDLDVQGRLYAFNLIPGNLKIKVIGSNRTVGDAGANGMDIVADIEAPGAGFLAKNDLHFRGRLVVNTIDVKNNAEIYYDVTLGSSGAGGGSPIVTVD